MRDGNNDVRIEQDGSGVIFVWKDTSTKKEVRRIHTKVIPTTQEDQDAINAFNNGDKKTWSKSEIYAAILGYLANPNPDGQFIAREGAGLGAISAIRQVSDS